MTVPEALAEVLGAVHGRHDRALLVTPRGVPWTTVNAQETMLRIRAILGLDRYTLHGLRATGPSKLAQDGVALVPLSLYFKDSRVKVELGLCKGKKLYDKRDSDAERNAKRDMDRAMKERNFKE